MPGRGRPRKPTQQKKLEGTFRPDRAPANEPQPSKGTRTPSAPAWLDDNAKAIWKRHAKKLWDLHLLTDLDHDALVLLCETQALYMTACEELRKPNGVVQFTETGYQTPTPWVSVRNQTFTQMHKMLTEFGMTPSSRSKINVPQEQEQVDPYEAFLGSETVKKKTRAASG